MTTPTFSAAQVVDALALGGYVQDMTSLNVDVIEALPQDELREELLGRLEMGDGAVLPPPDMLQILLHRALVMPAIERFKAIVLDASRPRALRAAVAWRILDEDTEYWHALVDNDDFAYEDETLPLESLFRFQLTRLGFYSENEFPELLEGVHEDFVDRLGPALEELRQEFGLGAIMTYGPVLERADLAAFHPPMLEAVAREEGSAGVELLERLRDSTDEALRPAFQRALLKARTELIGPPPEPRLPPGAEAWVSDTDLEGMLVVFARVPQKAGTEIAINLVMSLTGKLPQGLYMPNQVPGFLQAMMKPFLENRLPIAKVSLAEAGHAVRRIINATQQDVIPDTVRTAIDAMLRFADMAPEPPPPTPATAPTAEQFAALLATPPYITWCFDRAMVPRIKRLATVETSAPDEERVVREWFRGVGLACEHMAWWHQRRGENEEASLIGSVKVEEGGPEVKAFLEALATK